MKEGMHDANGGAPFTTDNLCDKMEGLQISVNSCATVNSSLEGIMSLTSCFSLSNNTAHTTCCCSNHLSSIVYVLAPTCNTVTF